jgi:chromosomal replication initiation ATPase DnaA
MERKEIMHPYMAVGLKFLPPRNDLGNILYNVANALNVRQIDITGTSRLGHISRARQIYCYIAREHLFTFHQIGQSIGKDHATVIHSCKVVKTRQYNKALLEDYNRVINLIYK